MPSRHQTNAGGELEYDSEPERMLLTKNQGTVLALVRGIRREERARQYLGACNRYGVEGRVKAAVVEKVREFG